MRTYEAIHADAADKSPFSNHTEFEIFAGSGKGCYDCVHLDECPILGVAAAGRWPGEWTRRTVTWESGDRSGSYEVVDECAEFRRRRRGGGEPDPPPPPQTQSARQCDGQVDMFAVFTDQIIEQIQQQQPARAVLS